MDAVTYDPTTAVLTARYTAPSRTRWAAYEYRGVTPDLYERVRSAGPLKGLVIAQQVAPGRTWRRVGSTQWTPAETDARAGDLD